MQYFFFYLILNDQKSEKIYIIGTFKEYSIFAIFKLDGFLQSFFGLAISIPLMCVNLKTEWDFLKQSENF